MSKYKIERPMPQFGEDIYSVIDIHNDVVEQIRADVIDEFIVAIKEKCHDRIFVADEKDVSLSIWESDLDSLADKFREKMNE